MPTEYYEFHSSLDRLSQIRDCGAHDFRDRHRRWPKYAHVAPAVARMFPRSITAPGSTAVIVVVADSSLPRTGYKLST